MNRIKELAECCNEVQRKMIKKMIHDAVDYVRSVVAMEVVADIFAKRN